MSELPKTYDPKSVEDKLYSFWNDSGFFHAEVNPDKKPYTIVIPPPNVTGQLHMGHAFDETLQDILIRTKRMQGYEALWMPGTDHAGIATQIKVEETLRKEEGKTRYDLGREKFLERVWDWKHQYGNRIISQLKKLGSSCDWERERFTMDEGCSKAVREVFVNLYDKGLIYKGHRIINWCPHCATALSDAEVEYETQPGKLWHIRYPLADGSGDLVVATTRPETFMGDTGVAVNPNDERYQHLIGKTCILPIMNREIPIFGDEYVDMEFGTGCVKVTPCHDPNDFEMGQRHNLEQILVFNEDATVNENGGKYEGMDRYECRKAVIRDLEEGGYLVKTEDHEHNVGTCYRCGTTVEPMTSAQWFVKMAPLAKPAMDVVHEGKTRFVPDRFAKTYLRWMENVHDWCISRQLWWGHRIPAFYCDDCGEMTVSKEDVHVCPKCGSKNVRQEEDVLDTWFSSALWPFSTLGWPENTDALRQFHPTSVMVSGFDIIFFWIARMIMMTMHFIKDENGKPQVPFHTVYMTGLIRDDEGQKMSKSKGNVIDPLDMVDGISLPELLEKRTGNMMQPQLADKIRKRTEKQFPNGIEPHGTDALRFTLAALASTGRDINWDMKRLEGYRNFCNKLWNASRFVLMNTEGQDCGFNGGEMTLSLADRWILAEFNQTIKAYREALDSFRFDIAAGILYEFTWNQFCDWYLELTKPVMNGGTEAELRGTRHTLVTVLEGLLRLAHPIIPFITETIWQRVKVLCGITADTIMLQPFPQYDASQVDEAALADTEWLKQAIVAVRNIRAEMNIAPGKPLELLLRGCSADAERRVNENRGFLQTLARLESITVLPADDKGPVSVTKIVDGAELLIPMAGLINKEDELARLAKEVAKIEGEISRIENKLANEGFVARAPEAVIAKEREKLEGYAEAKAKLIEQQAVIAAL